jgi:hypothetical protein
MKLKIVLFIACWSLLALLRLMFKGTGKINYELILKYRIDRIFLSVLLESRYAEKLL